MHHHIAAVLIFVAAAVANRAYAAVADVDANGGVWETTPAPLEPATYREGTVFYTRPPVSNTRASGSFIIAYWWVLIICLVAAVALLYTALLLWVCLHFKMISQSRYKSVILNSYLEHGYYDENSSSDGSDDLDSKMDGSGSSNRSQVYENPFNI